MGFWIFQIYHRLTWVVWSTEGYMDSHLIIEVTPLTSIHSLPTTQTQTVELLTFPVYPVHFPCSFSFVFYCSFFPLLTDVFATQDLA